MRPPYQITPEILKWHSEIARLCGLLEGWELTAPKPELRRGNRIRAIQGSLSIEGNTLSLDQVTAVLEGKRVLGPEKDVLEVQNAMEAYDLMGKLDVYSPKSFLKAHRTLMAGLIDAPGKWRDGSVGIQKGKSISHHAPPARRVPELMEELFKYLRSKKQESQAILSCVFHYEVSFIHPFMDGNGRIARLWQSALLRKHNPVFAFVPVESMVKRKQREYYRALEASDKKGESTPFIEFMLELIHGSLQEFIVDVEVPVQTTASRLQAAASRFGKDVFSRKEYVGHFKTLSTATASRDLRSGVDQGLLVKYGERATARYRFKNRAADG